MSNDWQNALASLLDSVTLPQGEDSPAEPQAKKPTSRLTISIEKKGRAGKTATIISGFNSETDNIDATAATLKSKLGTGGSARGGEILIQGDRRDDVRRLLLQMGYKL